MSAGKWYLKENTLGVGNGSECPNCKHLVWIHSTSHLDRSPEYHGPKLRACLYGACQCTWTIPMIIASKIPSDQVEWISNDQMKKDQDRDDRVDDLASKIDKVEEVLVLDKFGTIEKWRVRDALKDQPKITGPYDPKIDITKPNDQSLPGIPDLVRRLDELEARLRLIAGIRYGKGLEHG